MANLDKQKEKYRYKVLAHSQELLTDAWPGSFVYTIETKEIPADANVPEKSIVFTFDDMPESKCVVTWLKIGHYKTPLVVKYQCYLAEDVQDNNSDAAIVLEGIHEAQNADIQKVMPLFNRLRIGLPKRGVYYSDDEKREIVAAWLESGLKGRETQEEFAAKHNITDRTLRRWLKKFD